MEPVDEAEIWAPILANPLDSPPPSHTIPLLSEVEDYFNYVYNNYGMEIDNFIEKPQDKPWRDQYLGVFIPKENWSRGPRSIRKRKILPSNPPYLSNMPSQRRGKRFQNRKTTKKWKQEDAKKLVKGVKTYGVGKWKEVKLLYFSASREPAHLKDKWRNLLRACGVPCNSKRKEKAQKRMYRPLDSALIKEIQELATSTKNKECPRETTSRSGN